MPIEDSRIPAVATVVVSDWDLDEYIHVSRSGTFRAFISQLIVSRRSVRDTRYARPSVFHLACAWSACAFTLVLSAVSTIWARSA